MALARDSAPGLALFFALLSFSSLHRSGLCQQAIQLKIAALQYLSAPVKVGRLSPAEAARHVAASMLLSAFEVSCQQLCLSTKLTVVLKCRCFCIRFYSPQDAHLSGCGMYGEPWILPKRLAFKTGRTETILITFWIGPTITMPFLGFLYIIGEKKRYFQRLQPQSIPTLNIPSISL